MYKLAICGFGGIGFYHTTLIKNIESLSVKGVFDIKDERQKFALEQGFHAYDSYEDLLNDSEVDVVLVSTPNDSHKELSIKALKAHRNVICEKPVVMTRADYLDIVKVAKEVNKFFIVHQNRRWDEDFLIVRNIIEKNMIGDVFHIESRVLGASGIPGDWRKKKEQGGGMLLDWGVHLIDQLLLIKKEKIASLYLRPSYILSEEVDDGFVAHINFEDGFTIHVEVQTTNTIMLPRWYVKGTLGTAKIDDWSNKGEIIVTKDRFLKHNSKPIKAGQGLTKTMAPLETEQLIIEKLPEPYFYHASFYDHIVAVLDGKEEPIIKEDEVARVLNVLEKLFISGQENRIIKDIE